MSQAAHLAANRDGPLTVAVVPTYRHDFLHGASSSSLAPSFSLLVGEVQHSMRSLGRCPPLRSTSVSRIFFLKHSLAPAGFQLKAPQ